MRMPVSKTGLSRARCVAICLLVFSGLPAETFAQSLTTPEAATLAPDAIADRLLGPGHERIVRVSRPDPRQMIFPVYGVELYGRPVAISRDLCSANHYRVNMRGKKSEGGQPPIADVESRKISKIFGIASGSRCEDLDPKKFFSYYGEQSVQEAVRLTQVLIINHKTTCKQTDIYCDVVPSKLLKLTLRSCRRIPSDVCLEADFGSEWEFMSYTTATVRGHKRSKLSDIISWGDPIFTVGHGLIS